MCATADDATNISVGGRSATSLRLSLPYMDMPPFRAFPTSKTDMT